MSSTGLGHRVVLHVGAPKSGTTFLQRSLWARRAELQAVGVEPVGDEAREMFHAAIEVRGTEKFWRLEKSQIAGTWQRLCDRARSASGIVVMSHELLAAATPDRAAAALEALSGLEVHLVFTARDLGRQVPSEWQERIKNGGRQTFASFQDALLDEIANHGCESAFWRAHDVLDVLDRWGSGVPPERTHVVVAPPAGTRPEVLWQRFAGAVGFDGEAIAPEVDGAPSNQTLGAVQVGLLREINLELDGRIRQPQYARVVKRSFAQGLLAQQQSAPARCAPALLEELRAHAQARNEEVVRRGYRVHGDLGELVPGPVDRGALDPDALDPEVKAAAGVTAVADLLVESARRRRPPRTGGDHPSSGGSWVTRLRSRWSRRKRKNR